MLTRRRPRALERAIEGGVRLLAPLLEFEDGDGEFAGEEFHALAAQQAQDDLALRATLQRWPGARGPTFGDTTLEAASVAGAGAGAGCDGGA